MATAIARPAERRALHVELRGRELDLDGRRAGIHGNREIDPARLADRRCAPNSCVTATGPYDVSS